MTLKKYLNLMCILTGICWLGWVLVIFLINPERAGFIGFLLFYISLFLAILGTAAVVSFIIRAQFSQKPIFRQVEISFRQGIWISAGVVVLLLLKGWHLLRWWNILLLILFLVILELLFLGQEKKYKL